MRARLVLAFLLATAPALADVAPRTDTDSAPAISLPADGDDYSKLAAQAAAHDNSLDFRALRFAWLSSAARKRRSEHMLDGVTGEMMGAAQVGDIPKVRDKAVELLTLQYTSLLGQKMLRQSCAALHDEACAELGHFVEFGMLQSIMNSGDGKTCATGWEVALIGEEYFVLGMMDMRVKQQALIHDDKSGHGCDAMTVTDEKGETQTYFFTIDRVLADEAEQFKLK